MIGLLLGLLEVVAAESCFDYPSNVNSVCGNDNFPSSMSSYQTYNIYQPVQRPLLIVPGVGGSILYAQSKTSAEQHDAWAAYHGDDPSCQTFADINGTCYSNADERSFTFDFACSKPTPCLVDRFLGMYVNRTTGARSNLAEKFWDISVRSDNFGLCGIDDLDPNLIILSSEPMYFHEMLRYLSCTHGYQQGVNLFAFPYDWRLGPYDNNTVSSLADLIQNIACSNASSASCVPIDIVTHSMGGLLFSYSLATNSSIEPLIHSWSAIATPFQGSGVVSNAFVQGYNFDVGENIASIKTAHHFMMDWPASYALLPNPMLKWQEPPTIESLLNGQVDLKTVAVSDPEYWRFLFDVNANNTMLYVTPFRTISFSNTFNGLLFNEALAARKLIQNMSSPSFPVHVLYGNNTITAHSFTFSVSNADNRTAFFGTQPRVITTFGDGTVPAESAITVPFNATAGWVFDDVTHMDLVKYAPVFTTVMMAVGRGCMWTGTWADTAGHKVVFPFDFPPDDYAPDNKYYDSQADVWYQVDDACTTLTVSTTLIPLTRTLGIECGPKGRKPCANGGFRRCAYGYWSNQCY